ncbi:MAG TPA: PAS domain S-box protein [Bryobacteraceae bacterium]|jgi:PAS domain S-box-containing protein
MAERLFTERQGWIVTISLTLVSIAFVGVTLLYYARQREATEAAFTEEVAAIAQGRVAQIASWRRERLGDGLVQASSATMNVCRRILSSRTAASADQADLQSVMSQLEKQFLYAGAFLVDQQGAIRMQFPLARAAPSRLADFVRRAMHADGVNIEDLYLDAHSGRPAMALTIPVKGLGALILEIDPSLFLYPYLRSWPIPSASAEASLVRLEGANGFVYLNELRHRKGTALVYKRSLTGLQLPPFEAFEAGWSTKALDYRGVPVLSTIRHVPDSPWYLIAKIDAAEVDAPVKRLGIEMALIVTLIVIANLVAVGLVWRNQQVRIHKQREAWFLAVANDSPAYIWMTFGEGEKSFVNLPFRKFLGLGQGVLEETWTDYLHPDDAQVARDSFRECREARLEYVREFSIRRFDGEYRWVSCEALPRFSAEGKFSGYAGSIVDIHDRRQAEERLRTLNEVLAGELVERTRQEEEIRSLTTSLMKAQEEERGRLARELHDDLNQQIGALSIAMGNLKRQIPAAEATARLQGDRIQQKLVEVAETVRRISHRLHPAILEHSGLASAMRVHCEEFSSLTGIRVSLETEGVFERVPSSVSLGLFRITQEALQNVLKHAHVREAHVTLRLTGDLLCLAIVDRGAGMAPPAAPVSPGLGILSIKERARLIRGTVAITSASNQGTTVLVSVQLEPLALPSPA